MVPPGIHHEGTAPEGGHDEHDAVPVVSSW
jgi:hypothetical protein